MKFSLIFVLCLTSSIVLAQAKTGAELYKTNCVLCHGDSMKGDGPAGAALNPKPRNLLADKFKAGDKEAEIIATIKNGLKGTTMTGYAHLDAAQKDAIKLIAKHIIEARVKFQKEAKK